MPEQIAGQERVAAGALVDDLGQGGAAVAERPAAGRRGPLGERAGVQAAPGEELGPGGPDPGALTRSPRAAVRLARGVRWSSR